MLPTTRAAIGSAERGPNREDPVFTRVGRGLFIVLGVIIIVIVPRVRLNRCGQELSTLAPVDFGTLTEGSIEEGGLMEQRCSVLSAPYDTTGRVGESSPPGLEVHPRRGNGRAPS